MKHRRFARVSSQKTASALILSGGGYLYGIAVKTNGVDDVRVSAKDAVTLSGRDLIPQDFTFQGSEMLSFDNNPVAVDAGIYIGASSAGSFAFQVYYREV